MKVGVIVTGCQLISLMARMSRISGRWWSKDDVLFTLQNYPISQTRCITKRYLFVINR